MSYNLRHIYHPCTFLFSLSEILHEVQMTVRVYKNNKYTFKRVYNIRL